MDIMKAFTQKHLKAEPPVAQVGDTVRFTYAYTTDVTERDGEPHISVRKLMVE